MRRALLPAAALLLAAHASSQSAPVLLQDINARPAGTVNLGSDFKPLGAAPTSPPTLLFSAFTEAAGHELWTTQGTAATTRMVADWNPGVAGSNPGRIGVLADGTVVLPMDHPTAGRELHRVDLGQSVPNLTLLADGNPGGEGLEFPGCFQLLGSRLLYATTRPQPGGEEVALWATDGRTTGPIWRWAAGAPERVEIAVTGATLFASVQGALWRSDGTAAGTSLVPGSPGTFPRGLGDYNGALHFSAVFPGRGREPGRSDGSGVTLVGDLNPGADGSSPRLFAVVGEYYYFVADDGQNGTELWRMDITGAMTRLDVNPGAPGSDPAGLAVHGSKLLFGATRADVGAELFQVPGPGQAPELAFDFAPGPDGGLVRGIVSVGGRVYVAATVQGDAQVYGSDDDGRTWTRLTGFRPGQGGTRPERTTALGSQVLFAGDTDTVANELLRSDGTAAGTGLLLDVNGPVPATQNSLPGAFTFFRGLTFFRAFDGINPSAQVFETDGTPAGTRAAGTPPAGTRVTEIHSVRPLPGRNLLVMAARDIAGTGLEPWVYDVQQRRLQILKDIVPGSGSSDPGGFAGPFRVRGRELVLFAALTPGNERELWVTDGTPAGTVMVADIAPGSAGSFPDDMVDTGLGVVLFTAQDVPGNRELWQTDGTAAGTSMVELLPGPNAARPSRPANLGDGTMLFGADGPDGMGLWRWTPAGIGLVHRMPDDTIRHSMREVTAVGARVYFVAHTGSHGQELWTSDNTSSGTRLLHDVVPGPASGNAANLTAAGERLFFTATPDSPNRRVLFVTDGSSVTRLENAAGEPLTPFDLRAVGDRVWFLAFDGRGERGLWVSDGTLAGTRRAEDIRRGPQATDIPEYGFAGGRFFLAADDGVRGYETWVIHAPGAAVESTGTPCGPAAPTLRAGTPRLGATLMLRGGNVPAGHLALALLGAAPRAAGLDLGNGCVTQFDPGLFVAFDAFATGAGAPWARPVGIPNDGHLAGAQAVFSVLYAPLVAPYDLQGTNGQLATLGR